MEIELPPQVVKAIEELQSIVSQAAEIANKYNRLTKDVQRAVAPLAKSFDRIREWMETAPDELREAIGGSGLFVSAAGMTLHDLGDVTRAYREGGPDAAIQRLELAYDTMFSEPSFIGGRIEEWKADPQFGKRERIIRDALRAHESGLFGASVPALLSQFEGILTESMDPIPERARYAELKRTGLDLAAGEVLTRPLLDALLSDLWASFKWGGDLPRFGRHAILHGADVAYPTERNSQTAILLIDHLFLLRSGAGCA